MHFGKVCGRNSVHSGLAASFFFQFCPVGNFVICQSNPLSVVERGSPIVQPTTYLNQNITNGWRLKSLGTGGFLSLSLMRWYSQTGSCNIILSCRKLYNLYFCTVYVDGDIPYRWLHAWEYTQLQYFWLWIQSQFLEWRLEIPSQIF